MQDNTKIHEFEMKVGLLEKDYQQMSKLVEKLSESIEKIQEVNVNLMRMITLHEQRHDQHEKAEFELKNDTKELHSRITTVTRELHDKIEGTERLLVDKLDSLRQELLEHKNKDQTDVKIVNVLKEVDRYKWMILGSAVTLGWIIGNVDLKVLGTLLK
jgi:chromosome segregation ATPase